MSVVEFSLSSAWVVFLASEPSSFDACDCIRFPSRGSCTSDCGTTLSGPVLPSSWGRIIQCMDRASVEVRPADGVSCILPSRIASTKNAQNFIPLDISHLFFTEINVLRLLECITFQLFRQFIPCVGALSRYRSKLSIFTLISTGIKLLKWHAWWGTSAYGTTSLKRTHFYVVSINTFKTRNMARFKILKK